MSHPIDYHFLAFYFEKNPVTSHSQPVFRCEVSEPLYISREVIRQGFNSFNDVAGFAPVNCSEVFDRSGFEFDFVVNLPPFAGRHQAVRPSRLRQARLWLNEECGTD
jgi:hypothetical protein